MRKFLIIQTSFLGDVVLATALVEKLHQFYPSATIDFLLRKGNEELLQHHPKLSKVWIWDKKKHKYKNLFILLQAIRKEKYTHVINLQRFAATGLLTVFSGASQTIGFDKNPFSVFFNKKIVHQISNLDHPIHEIERNQQLIAHITDEKPTKPALYPSPEDINTADIYAKTPYIVIAPASIWFTKMYPIAQWIELLNTIPENINCIIIGAPSDFALGEAIKERTVLPNVLNLCGKLSFLASVALQKNALMNFVNDSAPMHFASAINAPVTAIYCSTVPEFGFGPLSDKQFIVQSAVPLACRPCGLHGKNTCPEGHFACATQITTKQLLAGLTSILPESLNQNNY